MARSIGQRILRWVWWGVAAVVGFLLAAVLLGLLWQATASARDERRFPPPGRLVDVGGHRLHIHCLGEEGPTVVFDAGIGSWSVSWWKVQRQVAGLARACVFDRAGLGWSEAGPWPRTSRQIAAELHTLLQNAGIRTPVVLVGHSFGGYNVRLFADQYRDEVAGVVLVDSAQPEQWERLPPEAKALLEEAREGTPKAVWLARVGLLRLMGGRSEKDLPPELREAHQAAMLRTRTFEAIQAELDSVYESGRQVAATRSLDGLPLAVVSARNSFDAFRSPTVHFPAAADDTWMELQRELAALSTDSRQFISETGTHRLYETEPDLVTEAVRDVLARIPDGALGTRK